MSPMCDYSGSKTIISSYFFIVLQQFEIVHFVQNTNWWLHLSHLLCLHIYSFQEDEFSLYLLILWPFLKHYRLNQSLLGNTHSCSPEDKRSLSGLWCGNSQREDIPQCVMQITVKSAEFVPPLLFICTTVGQMNTMWHVVHLLYCIFQEDWMSLGN